jgi:hypothetical protein
LLLLGLPLLAAPAPAAAQSQLLRDGLYFVNGAFGNHNCWNPTALTAGSTISLATCARSTRQLFRFRFAGFTWAGDETFEVSSVVDGLCLMPGGNLNGPNPGPQPVVQSFCTPTQSTQRWILKRFYQAPACPIQTGCGRLFVATLKSMHNGTLISHLVTDGPLQLTYSTDDSTRFEITALAGGSGLP